MTPRRLAVLQGIHHGFDVRPGPGARSARRERDVYRAAHDRVLP